MEDPVLRKIALGFPQAEDLTLVAFNSSGLATREGSKQFQIRSLVQEDGLVE